MPKPWEGEGGSFGSWLRQQREIRNINLREISENTKIGMRYLEALEEDRFDVLPAPIFAKGFLREYAKYVGLDPDEVVNFYLTAEQRYRAEHGGDDVSGVHPIPAGANTAPLSTAPPPNPLPWLIGAAAVIVVVIVIGIVWFVKHHHKSAGAELPQAEATPTMLAEQAPPAVAEPTPPLGPVVMPSPAVAAVTGLPPGAQPVVVTLTFTAECWVEAVADGDRHISELRVQGESMRIEARDSITLTLGNAGAVRGDVNGRPLRFGGAVPGQVVRNMKIDRVMAGLPPLPVASPTPAFGRQPRP